MYASTAGGGAMCLVFKPDKQARRGTVTSVKLPDITDRVVKPGRKRTRKPPQDKL